MIWPTTSGTDCATSSVATSSSLTIIQPAHQHCYKLERVTANQHARTEHRVCCCGKKVRWITRWAERSVAWVTP